MATRRYGNTFWRPRILRLLGLVAVKIGIAALVRDMLLGATRQADRNI